MIKVVLFDMDGTILNTLDDLADSLNHVLEQYGLPTHETEKYKHFVGNGIPVLCERVMPEDKRSDKALYESIYHDFLEYYGKHSLDKTAPYKGIPELAEALRERGLHTAVITNKAQPAADKVLEHFFPNMFDFVIGQISEMPTKPHPAGTFKALERLGVTADEALFIGDSSVDMQTAKNAGIDSVGVLWGFRDEKELRDNGAKYIVSSPEQILDLI